MRASVWLVAVGAIGTSAAALLVACGQFTSGQCTDTETCTQQGDGGPDGTTDVQVVTEGGAEGSADGGKADGGGADGGDGAAACDVLQDPKGSACVLEDANAIFVATYGASSNPGTMERPVDSIATALGKAKAASRHAIVVCAGTYTGAVTIDSSASELGVFGGFSCPGGDAGSGWTWMGSTLTTTVNSGSYTPALTVAGDTHLLRVTDITFVAQTATGTTDAGAGNSSIAGWVNGSTDVSLMRTAFVAGDGAPGTDGGAFVSNMFTGPIVGNVADGGAGGAALQCSCPDGVTWSLGGAGGNGTAVGLGTGYAGSGGDGGSNPAATPNPPRDGVGGIGEILTTVCTASCTASDGCYCDTTCVPGHRGAPGAQVDGGSGAASLGSIVATGWAASGGGSGPTGEPGQGGGGGGGAVGALPANGAGGGGGGCGGCGGAGGIAGQGGGSSFALAIFGSTVVLTSPKLTAGNGGNGGAGSTGEAGGGGGGGGGTVGACSGGQGGPGSGGGGGGGGAGGSSVGIAWSGTSNITIDGAMVSDTQAAPFFVGGTFGGGGGPGSGGPAATLGNAGPAGTQGVPGVTYAVKRF